MDAYRTAGFQCPFCPDAPLREFGSRLVCDACNGILLSVDDFAAQVGTGEAVAVIDQPSHRPAAVLRGPAEPGLDDGGATRGCPRCQRQMRGCVLAVGKRRLAAALVRCERHGIWFADGSLEDVYAEIGSNGGLRSRRGDGGFGHLYGGGDLRRLALRRKKPPPLVHSAPVPPTAFRDHRLACPNAGCAPRALRHDVSRWACDGCEGVFVEHAALEALVSDMTGHPWEVPPVMGQPGARPCPVCTVAMAVEPLEGVTIDRCVDHGVWFDLAELETALQHASGVDTSTSGGFGSWLRKLFFTS